MGYGNSGQLFKTKCQNLCEWLFIQIQDASVSADSDFQVLIPADLRIPSACEVDISIDDSLFYGLWTMRLIVLTRELRGWSEASEFRHQNIGNDKWMRIEGTSTNVQFVCRQWTIRSTQHLCKPSPISHYSPSTTTNTSSASSPSRDPLGVDGSAPYEEINRPIPNSHWSSVLSSSISNGYFLKTNK